MGQAWDDLSVHGLCRKVCCVIVMSFELCHLDGPCAYERICLV